MSKKTKGRDNSLFNIILVAIVMLVLTPVIPIGLILICIFYIAKIKAKYVIAVGTGLLIFVTLVFQDLVLTFGKEFGAVASNSITKAFESNLLYGIIEYKNYSISSWVYIFLISLVLAGYFVYRMQKNQKLEQAGIKPLEPVINNLNKPKIQIKETTKKEDKKDCTLIGYTKSNKAVFCSDKAKHVFISGTTGSGKTVLLANYIKTAIQKQYGLLVIDGKGDQSKGSILELCKSFCEKYNRKLYVINMNDVDNSDKYNPFVQANETIIKDMIINMTNWSEEHYKVNTERYIQRLVKLLKLAKMKISFELLIKYMLPNKLLELSNQLAEKEMITKEMHIQNTELVKSSGKIAQDAGARFATLAESEVGKIFDGDGIDIFQAMKEKAVILFVLNPLSYPETSQTMGKLALIDAKKAVSKMFQNSDFRKFFIFDEINVYASTTLVDLINKSRSANVTCINATQSLSDLDMVAGESFRNQIIENCNNYIVLRQNTFKSAEEWSKTFGTFETMNMTFQIGNHDGESSGGEKGSARKVREFIVHPDEIKSQKTGIGVFLSRDTGQCERIKIVKPF